LKNRKKRRRFQSDPLKNRSVGISVIRALRYRKILQQCGGKNLHGEKVRQLEEESSSEMRKYSKKLINKIEYGDNAYR